MRSLKPTIFSAVLFYNAVSQYLSQLTVKWNTHHKNVVVQSLSQVWLSVTPWTAACQASPSFTISWSLLKLISIQSAMPSNHLILCCPLLLQPSIFHSSRVFSRVALCIRRPKYWASASAWSPSNEYSGLISFKIDGLISLLSKGLSGVFFITTIQKHQYFDIQPSLWSNSQNTIF